MKTEKVNSDVCTAKRLGNLAQGCRVTRLPWDRIVGEISTPKGLRLPRLRIPTQPRWGGIAIVRSVTQGSREARQPWAKLPNRFAV
jgi:hypothetical protein